MIIDKYDCKLYNFKSILSEMLEVHEDKLEYIHDSIDKQYEKFNVQNDQSTIFHKKLYDKMNHHPVFLSTYKEFILKVIRPSYKESILYQKTPTFRFSLPNNVAVGEFHKDSDYSHSKLEVNYFIPVTDCFDTSTIWVETKIGSGKYRAINLKNGEYLKFDGANLMHGNKINKTGKTRVSFDFRILKKSDYDKKSDFKNSITQNKKMILGDYWELIC